MVRVKNVSPQNPNIFNFFTTGLKNYQVEWKNPWIKAGSAPYLLQVRSMLWSCRVRAHLYTKRPRCVSDWPWIPDCHPLFFFSPITRLEKNSLLNLSCIFQLNDWSSRWFLLFVLKDKLFKSETRNKSSTWHFVFCIFWWPHSRKC